MTESKYDSRVILTFVLRIPKVKLGAGGQAVGARHPCPPRRGKQPPRAANTHSYPCTTASSTAGGATVQEHLHVRGGVFPCWLQRLLPYQCTFIILYHYEWEASSRVRIRNCDVMPGHSALHLHARNWAKRHLAHSLLIYLSSLLSAPLHVPRL